MTPAEIEKQILDSVNSFIGEINSPDTHNRIVQIITNLMVSKMPKFSDNILIVTNENPLNPQEISIGFADRKTGRLIPPDRIVEYHRTMYPNEAST